MEAAEVISPSFLALEQAQPRRLAAITPCSRRRREEFAHNFARASK
jgi:hypothetical protein